MPWYVGPAHQVFLFHWTVAGVRRKCFGSIMQFDARLPEKNAPSRWSNQSNINHGHKMIFIKTCKPKIVYIQYSSIMVWAERYEHSNWTLFVSILARTNGARNHYVECQQFRYVLRRQGYRNRCSTPSKPVCGMRLHTAWFLRVDLSTMSSEQKQIGRTVRSPE